MERMARLGILAAVQPYHAIDDGRWAERKIGPERCRTTYAFRSLWTKASGSPPGPIGRWRRSIPGGNLCRRDPADNRREKSGRLVSGAEDSLEEALRAYTTDGAYAEFAEGSKGAIKAGFLADLVILDRNLFEIPAENISDVRVKTTIVAGRTVFPD